MLPFPDLVNFFLEFLAFNALQWLVITLVCYWPLWVILKFARPFFSFLHVVMLVLWSVVAVLSVLCVVWLFKYVFLFFCFIIKYPLLLIFKTALFDIIAHIVILSVPAAFFLTAYFFSYRSVRGYPASVIHNIILKLYIAAAVICGILYCRDFYTYFLTKSESIDGFLTWHFPFFFFNFAFLIIAAIVHALSVKEEKTIYKTSFF